MSLRDVINRKRVLVLLGAIVAIAVVWQHFISRPKASPPAAFPGETVVKLLSPDGLPRPAATWLEAQIELSRRAFSCGSIDGVAGSQTVAALQAFQENEGLRVTSQLDPDTRARLELSEPPLTRLTLTAEDLASLQPLSPTWLGKSQQSTLAYETAL